MKQKRQNESPVSALLIEATLQTGGKKLTEAFTDQENIDTYKPLTNSLNSQFQTILQKCTMRGESHNQLHHYLLPMKAQFEILSSDDLLASKEAYQDL